MSIPAEPGVRARNRAALESQLRDVGRRHLAEHGAAALSLRAVARDMGRTPSSLYRYVRDRDDLLTVLIVDAYDDLGDALDTAVAGHEPDKPRFEAFAHALRAWACAHPSEYALLYGSPVPGYHAPADATARAGNRPILALARIVAGLAGVPDVPGTDATRQRRAVDALRAATREDGVVELGLTAEVLTRTVAAWNLLLGAITSELFEQLGPITDRPDDIWAGIVDLAGALVFPTGS
ncbi:TetR/AcrR family transcriptional regulator [Gordonia sp. PDNC005]|uniref:TetR/AcrR family transcriptional regulator n=1 Tax=unclassified Gordonia (in: high G+C Gram-positive bacteria) TaxID=2657482 RepID=UPI001963B32E|nr:TetR/AcrR family transcriptional regulator [Gordonia sp. PDNC005]QRY61210.1 TetR/AcrR family transcriptional regulator [Gordonia sp. PDNC005]